MSKAWELWSLGRAYACRVPELEARLGETLEIFAEPGSAAQVFFVLVAILAPDEHVVHHVVEHTVPVLRWPNQGVGSCTLACQRQQREVE